MSDVAKIPLWGGLDTKTDPKEVALGRLTTASNVYMPNAKRLNKRFGQAQLSTSIANTQTSITAATSLGTRQNELLLFDGAQLYTYGTQGANWITKGALTELNLTSTQVVQNSASRSAVTCYNRGGIELYAWEDSRGGVRYSVRDSTSGAFYVADTLVDAGASRPQIVFTGSYLILLYAVGNSINARLLAIAAPGAGLGNPTNLASNYLAGGPYTVTSLVGGANSGRFFLVYSTTLSSTQVVVSAFGGGTLSNQFNSVCNLPGVPLGLGSACDPTGSWFGFSYATSGSVGVQLSDSNNSSFADSHVTTPGNWSQATMAWTDAGDFTCFFDQTSSSTQKTCIVSLPGTNTNGVPSVSAGALKYVWGLQLSSHAFAQGSQAFAVGVSPKTTLTGSMAQSTSNYVVSGAGAILLRCQEYAADGPNSVLTQPSVYSGTSNWLLGLPNRLQLRADSSGTVYASTGLNAVTLSFPITSQLRSVEFHYAAVLNCGNVYAYDGTSIVEAGFWEFPEGCSATVVADAASSIPGPSLTDPTPIYNICAVYEWTDAQGNYHRSAPSYLMQATITAAGQGISVKVPTLALTRRQAPLADIQVTIYRTLPNQAGPYYLEGTVSNAPAFAGTPAVFYQCRKADTDLSGQLELYAPPDGSGELENDPPPPFICMAATKTRVFGIPQEDQTAIWFTKPLTPGRPAEWSVAQVVRIESAGGNATALGALDDRLAIFKTSRVYVLPGDGPDASGQGGTFSFPKLLSTASGCTNPASIVMLNDGLFYQSQRGVELLSRGEQVNLEIGFPVAAYKSLSLTGALVVPDLSQVRFISSLGTALVFDYALNTWTTYTNYDGVGAVYWNGACTRAKSNGQVWQESNSTFLDGVVAVPLTVETGWIHPDSLSQGFMRVRRGAILGDYRDSHTLNIDIAYDYKDYAYTITWNPQTGLSITHYGDGTPYGQGVDQVFGGSASGASIYQLRFRLPSQKCQAVRFRIRDSQITGESCTLSQLALELESKGGLIRLPAGQTA